MALSFNDIRDRISGAGQATTQKAKEITEVVRLNGVISDAETKISELYAKLGYEVYSKCKETPLPGLEEIFAQLNELHNTIASSKQQIQVINAANLCPNCGAKVKAGMAFCSNCGFKLPEPEPKVDAAMPQFCGNCGAPVAADAVFCTSCGAKLN